MIGVHARYRGRERRRGEYVSRSAEALSSLPGVAEFEVVGVEDIRADVDTPEHALNLVMAFVIFKNDTNAWVNFKVFGMTAIFFLFSVGQAMMLVKHVPQEEA